MLPLFSPAFPFFVCNRSLASLRLATQHVRASPTAPQIEHAGEGGLYAEMVQDRSFDAVAMAAGFLSTNTTHQAVNLAALAAQHHHALETLGEPWDPKLKVYASKSEYLLERAAAAGEGSGTRCDDIAHGTCRMGWHTCRVIARTQLDRSSS